MLGGHDPYLNRALGRIVRRICNELAPAQVSGVPVAASVSELQTRSTQGSDDPHNPDTGVYRVWDCCT
ncbi:hypothetical protein VTI28DRAFT_848 [Corynascus sepedonium]